MSIFEIIMLLCFGAAWPVSIYKSWTSCSTAGKSFLFMMIILLGYAAGMMHKIFYSPDKIFFLYMLNFTMVLADSLIYCRNLKRNDS